MEAVPSLHPSVIYNTSVRNNPSKMKWKSLTGLFFIQFFLHQLILCYGIYAVYLVKESVSIINTVWSPLIFITCFKVTSPLFRDIVESYSDRYFRRMLVTAVIFCSFGISINYVSSSLVFRAIFYGGFGGISASCIRCLVQCRILDIFQQKTILVSSIENFGIAFGLFITPHFIHFLFDIFECSSYVFLIHGAILLNCIPAGLLLGKTESAPTQSLTKYKSFSFAEEFGEELIDISNSERNLNTVNKMWNTLSDYMTDSLEEIPQNDEYIYENPMDQNEYSGISILPQIIEEDEEESDEDVNIFNKQTFVNNIKRLSTISSKFEELISKEEETVKRSSLKEIILDVTNPDHAKSEALKLEFESVPRLETSCCTPYQKYRFRRRFKSFYLSLINSTISPLLTSLGVIEFYPCVIFTLHSLLNPLIYLLFINFKNDKVNELSLAEVSFTYSLIGFSFLCFLIGLPWVVFISKKNLKFVYVFGALISTAGILVFQRTNIQNYIVLSCLIYGFGFGIEFYTKEIIITNFLGLQNFSKVEGSLDCISGILLVIFVTVINEFVILSHINRWFQIIFYSHIVMSCMWLICPPLINIIKLMKSKFQAFEMNTDL